MLLWIVSLQTATFTLGGRSLGIPVHSIDSHFRIFSITALWQWISVDIHVAEGMIKSLRCLEMFTIHSNHTPKKSAINCFVCSDLFFPLQILTMPSTDTAFFCPHSSHR